MDKKSLQDQYLEAYSCRQNDFVLTKYALAGDVLCHQPFALGQFAGQLAGAANSFAFFASALFGRLFISPATLQLTIEAFTLKLLFQDAERLVDIVVTNEDLQCLTLSCLAVNDDCVSNSKRWLNFQPAAPFRFPSVRSLAAGPDQNGLNEAGNTTAFGSLVKIQESSLEQRMPVPAISSRMKRREKRLAFSLSLPTGHVRQIWRRRKRIGPIRGPTKSYCHRVYWLYVKLSTIGSHKLRQNAGKHGYFRPMVANMPQDTPRASFFARKMESRMIVKHPYLCDTRFACFAHRGGGKEQPENSRRAFEAARSLGFRFIEIDVQASLDGTLIVFHDDHLDDLTSGSGVVSALPISTVLQAKIGGTEPLMTLEEALLDFPDMRFNIDIKTDHALEPTLALMQKMNCLNRVCLASFSDERLDAVRQHFGDAACTGAGPRDVTRLKFGSWFLPVPKVAANCAQVPVKHGPITIPTRRFVRYCNGRGVAVHVWTVDDEDEMRQLIRIGVNGLITDRPTLLKKVAMEEGVWE